MFLDPHDFPFVPTLEAATPAIVQELAALPEGYGMRWHERWMYEGDWRVVGLMAFGRVNGPVAARCPQTMKALESVPGLETAGFSRLAPGTSLRMHRGYTEAVYRGHLGLEVPDGDCAMTVETETRPWARGRVTLFDDTLMHAAWNRADTDRVVLLFDFLRDPQTVSWKDRLRRTALYQVVRVADLASRWVPQK